MKSTGKRWLYSTPGRNIAWEDYIKNEFDSLTRFLQQLETRLAPSETTYSQDILDLTETIGDLQLQVNTIQSALTISETERRIFNSGIPDDVTISSSQIMILFDGEEVTGDIINNGTIIVLG